MSEFTVVDLFCGAGGMSAGLIDAGMRVAVAVDHFGKALEVYRHNIGDHAYSVDLNEVQSAIEFVKNYEPDMIAGGPPCQDFSSAGQRSERERANLTVKFSEIIAGAMPRFFLMENVPMARKSNAYRTLKTELAGRGFKFSEQVLDASRYGVPQLRKRLFVFGWRNSSNAGMKFEEYMQEKSSDQRLTVKEYLGSEIDVDYYYRHARNYSRRSVFTVAEPSPVIRTVNRPVPPGYVRNHLDSADPALVRPLLTRERSRIQTFPKYWNWLSDRERDSAVEICIGNAVPVNMASVLGAGILHAIGN